MKVINDFYNSLDELNVIGQGIDGKIEELSGFLKEFDLEVNKITIDESLKKENDDIARVFDSSTKTIKTSVSSMINNIHNYLNKENFRDEFNDSFIVIIYGKVKAGKSTLGNFIASKSTLKEKAKFYVYDKAGDKKEAKKLEEIEEDNFKTDNLECTSSIQVFRLGNLTWVDTPGLGSMTKENGDLARDYINKADYIIFPTSSSQPLQKDEIEEIEELISQNKELTLCITRSDDIELFEDEKGDVVIDENGNLKSILVNKTKERRKKQEDDLRKRLSDNIEKSEKIEDIFSISVICAKNGLETDDKDLFENSNIDIFYERMLDIVKNKAKKLKEDTPYKTLIGFINNNILIELDKKNGVNFQIEVFKNKVNEISENLNLQKDDILKDISIILNSILSKYALEITADNSKNKLAQVDKEFKEKIESLTSTAIETTLKEFTKSVNSFTSKLKDSSSFEIKDKYENIDVEYDNSSGIRKFFNKVTFGFVEKDIQTMSERVYIGDNKEEILLNYKQDRISYYENEIKNIFSSIQKNYFDKLKDTVSDIESNVKKFTNSVNNFKNKLEER